MQRPSMHRSKLSSGEPRIYSDNSLMRCAAATTPISKSGALDAPVITRPVPVVPVDRKQFVDAAKGLRWLRLSPFRPALVGIVRVLFPPGSSLHAVLVGRFARGIAWPQS